MPVVEGGEVIGIFSERDVLYCVAKHGDGALDLLVGDGDDRAADHCRSRQRPCATRWK